MDSISRRVISWTSARYERHHEMKQKLSEKRKKVRIPGQYLCTTTMECINPARHLKEIDNPKTWTQKRRAHWQKNHQRKTKKKQKINARSYMHTPHVTPYYCLLACSNPPVNNIFTSPCTHSSRGLLIILSYQSRIKTCVTGDHS